MKLNFEFAQLLGAVYRKGNLIFSPDGNSVISPVGNRVSVFDLKNSKTRTLKVESRTNFTALALSPDGVLLIGVNEDGDALLISLLGQVVLGSHRFTNQVTAVSFSPDGTKFAVLQKNLIFVFKAPGRRRQFNPFEHERTFYSALDDNVSLDWSSDSQLLAVGSLDMQTRIFPVGDSISKRFCLCSVAAHSDAIVGSFFVKDSYQLYTISANRQLRAWKTEVNAGGIVAEKEEDDDDEEEEDESEEEEEEVVNEKEKTQKERLKKANAALSNKKKSKVVSVGSILKYSLGAKQKLTCEGVSEAAVTCVDYHKDTKILVAGFENGAFLLFEMPELNLIHQLAISDKSIASVSFNNTGDWIAFGCSGIGQLLVWEWQSETYIVKQQGHFNNMSCLSYSPDGLHVATGGEDGKVKLWKMATGFSHVTFSEHSAAIVSVVFTPNGKVCLSASLDGTVRAFDLKRYRNFKTLTSPTPVQFSCLAVDPSGEIVTAGGMDVFDIYVWSLQTGRLLEVLTGHEAPVAALQFSPTAAVLASSSWDKSLRTWDVFEAKGSKEIFNLVSDGLTIVFRPDGQEVAVATLDGQVLFWDIDEGSQRSSIEGRHDLGYGRRETDKISGKKIGQSKAFKTICYSADGGFLLAAGDSPFICIYSCSEGLLVRKFQITCNMSLDGMAQFLDRRQMTEFGSLALVERDDGVSNASLPGTHKGDLSERNFKPEVRVTQVAFSPTGREFAACSTEGLNIFSLDVTSTFDPFELELNVTPAAVKAALHDDKDYKKALILAFKLNDVSLVQRVVETVPLADVNFLVASIPLNYVETLLKHLSHLMETSPHLQFYLKWVVETLMTHGPALKARSTSSSGSTTSSTSGSKAVLTALQKTVTTKWKTLEKICNSNLYSMDFLLALSRRKRKAATEQDEEEAEEEEEEEEEEVLMGFTQT